MSVNTLVNGSLVKVAGVESSNNGNFQVTELPEATSAYAGIIFQYVGETTLNYTNGYFYKCVSDGASNPTYSWEHVYVDTDMPIMTQEELAAMWN